MTPTEPDTDLLLARASRGDDAAREQLLRRHRDRLRRMVAVRLDPRLAARVDPSDVVQDVLAEAVVKLADYLRRRPLPFYPWLRQLAWQRLVKLQQRHLAARKRSVLREEPAGLPLPDESALRLAHKLVASGTSPSQQAARDELCQRVRAALERLGERNREVLVMRYLEQLSNREIAAALGLSEGAVKMRHLRALACLRQLLGAN